MSPSESCVIYIYDILQYIVYSGTHSKISLTKPPVLPD